jgi:ribosome-binding protein aMBF1 (putative translation factor)
VTRQHVQTTVYLSATYRCRIGGPESEAVPLHEPVPQLARNLRASREIRGLSQVKLARRSGVDLSFINQLENAHADATMRTLLRLARALGATPADLLRDIE